MGARNHGFRHKGVRANQGRLGYISGQALGSEEATLDSDDALVIDRNAVLHMTLQLAIEIKPVMLRDKYILLNILD